MHADSTLQCTGLIWQTVCHLKKRRLGILSKKNNKTLIGQLQIEKTYAPDMFELFSVIQRSSGYHSIVRYAGAILIKCVAVV